MVCGLAAGLDCYSVSAVGKALAGCWLLAGCLGLHVVGTAAAGRAITAIVAALLRTLPPADDPDECAIRELSQALDIAADLSQWVDGHRVPVTVAAPACCALVTDLVLVVDREQARRYGGRHHAILASIVGPLADLETYFRQG